MKMRIPFVNTFSALRLAHQDGQHGVCIVFARQSCPRGSKKHRLKHVLGWGFRASNLALRCIGLHNLTALADLTYRTPFRGWSGGQTWPLLGLNRGPSGPKIASPLGLLQVKFDFTGCAARPEQVNANFTDHSDFMD